MARWIDDVFGTGSPRADTGLEPFLALAASERAGGVIGVPSDRVDGELFRGRDSLPFPARRRRGEALVARGARRT